MNKKTTLNFILTLSFMLIVTSQHAKQNAKPNFQFDFEDVSYNVYINNQKHKIGITKKSSNNNRRSVMMCAISGFTQKNPNNKVWENQLPDKSIITIDKGLQVISITRDGKTISESIYLQNLHKYFRGYQPYKP